MISPTSQEVTARFYTWEERGRGWNLFDFQVEPEPEFYPFFRAGNATPRFIDDATRHTLASWALSALSFKKKEAHTREIPDEIPPVRAFALVDAEELVAYDVVLPKGEKLQVKDMGQLLIMLSYTKYPVSFEIVGTASAISISVVCRESDAAHVYGQIQAYMPAAIVSKSEKAYQIVTEGLHTCIVDFALSEEFMRPMATASDMPHDPFIGLFATLEHLQRNEKGIIQILFKGTVNPWAESIMRSVTDSHGGSFFEDAPEMVKLAQQKVSSPLFTVCVKVGGQASYTNRAIEIMENISSALTRLTRSASNSLVMLSQSGYPQEDMILDMRMRRTHRTGMLLNTGELATLAHFPTPEISSRKLVRDSQKTKPAPQSALGHEFVLGTNTHHGTAQLVSVPSHMRLRHTHIIGATGAGKSTLLLSMIAQDMEHGNGIAVLDPHGDLIETILTYVPEDRIKDVIVIDPADGEYPVGFNILSAHSEIEKDILSSDLVAAFKRLSTSWGDQMNSVFANAILAFLESKDGGTLVDLRRFLVEKSFRDAYLKTITDPHIVYYWLHEYPLLKSSSIGSILTRLDTFLRPKLIRNMVAQRKSLDFESILDTRKILLIKLSQGLIGAENSFLLGTFFVSKIYQAAMARQAKSKADRSEYFLYCDEFQNFITPSMSYILSGARKYGLGLILAHQDMQQLQRYDTELASSVVVNAGTRICFRLGDVDARRFASGFTSFEAEDLENLHVGEAIARIEQPNFDFNLTTISLPEVDAEYAETISHAVITQSRTTYGTPKDIVEESLRYIPAIPQEQPRHTKKEEVIEEQTIVIPPAPQPVEEPPTPFIPVEISAPPKPKKAETEHRYLQVLIKKMAEARGYKAALEELTPDGAGRVDVSLERNGKKIACEISVTTSDVWEAHNVEKCLAAGYMEVIVCSNDITHLRKISAQLEAKLPAEQRAQVLVFEAHEVVAYFDRQIVEEQPREKVVKGYRVKVRYDDGTNEAKR
ncbi:hypothetical protein CJD36_009175 [Flavipsychrobacter stenotrophus]|uniref:Type IV secretion system coupling protein TraD DNA-binding domain-containing protein n=1 Tax=Flavipsychrobacter stenotrophus TaxID=2077091 RepID=A0A2S7SYC8_9BACT|nr:type IV secretion system DNA-binding domain-containing protein [Flavipsychrobacter stenotrophus]PQJ11953.1 hypothetical protein CJD36_009175 [Flavipsychrobacter stenotrophus]